MSKVFLLGANKEIDKAKQVVEVNQVIQMEGYSYHRYVVYDITKKSVGNYLQTDKPYNKRLSHSRYYQTIKRKIRNWVLLRQRKPSIYRCF